MKRVWCLILCAVLLVCALPFAVGAATVIEIDTKEEFNNIRNNLSAHYKLTADIVFEAADFAQGGAFYNGGKGFAPIGSTTAPFMGMLDGDGHTVSGLVINALVTENEAVENGLFGCIRNATVKNLRIYDMTLDFDIDPSAAIQLLDNYAGALAARNLDGTIENCAVYGDITVAVNSTVPKAKITTGVLVGMNNGTINNCAAYGTLTLSRKAIGWTAVGALIGNVERDADGSAVTDCFATVDISYTSTAPDNGGENLGDLVGVNYASLTDCYYTSNYFQAPFSTNSNGTVSDCSYVAPADMLNQNTYANLDFVDEWKMALQGPAPKVLKCFDGGDSDYNCDFCGKDLLSAPTMAADPVNTTVTVGETASLNVRAVGVALSYQWYCGDTALTNGGAYSGVDTATLSIKTDSTMCKNAALNYYCIVSNAAGQVQSRAATVTVNHKVSALIPVTPATCGVAGVGRKECTACGTTLQTGISIPATGNHTPGNWTTVTPATLLKEGSEQQKCNTCATVIATRAIPKVKGTDVSTIFKDVKKSDWFYTNNSVYYAYNAGLFNGTSKTTFEPNASMTRAMFVTVLGRLHGAVVDHSAPSAKFKDVKAGEWYTGYVKWASDNGIVNGTSNTAFSPNDNVTREQICAMMVRYCDHAKITLGDVNKPITFKDAGKISDYAKVAVATCQKAGLVNGKGNNQFDPTGKATRAEVATILMNFTVNYL